jgi:DNA-binding response OmpR family regulator
MEKANEVQNDGEEKRCVLVEDSIRAKSEYIEFLEHSGFSIQFTNDKEEALKRLGEWQPHVLLVHFTRDIPRSISLIKEVYEKDSTVSIIYTTAYQDNEVFVNAMNAGAFWVLRKPFLPIELETILERAFKESAQKKNLILSSSNVFVLMPFEKSFDDIYQFGIKEPLVDKGLKCERADEIQDTGGIMEQVFNRIRRARFIVADMTGRNANVFYEVGYAHAIGKDVILLTKEKEDVPFDLRGYYHIKYGDSIKNLKKMLLEKVDALLSKVV